MLSCTVDEGQFDINSKSSTRLIITKIVVDNFKSYAGRHEIGPFHKSFSSIVGPNGSGKSNVIDAIMFVLGYRAKKMRQAKLSDLIHVSDGMVEIESCSVEVHFQKIIDKEGSNYDVISGSEIIVTRTAFRNNRNSYHLNGVTSNIGDINTLLRSHGIDLDHKRFLILQGEIESIAMMKAKASNEYEEGLLEYLEDIIGTNQYIQLIEESAKELDEVNNLHSEKLVKVRASERECRSLQTEKEEAEAFLKRENELEERRSELFQVTIWQNKGELIKMEKRLIGNKSQLDEEREKNLAQSKIAEEIEGDLKSATKGTNDLQKKLQKLQSELSSLEQSDVKLQEKRKQLKSKLKSISKQSQDSSKQRGDLCRNIEDVTANIQQLSNELPERRNELDVANIELNKISSSLKGKTSTHQKKLESKQLELIPFQDQLRIVQQEFDMTKSSLALIENQSNIKEKEVSDLQERLERASINFKESEKKKDSLHKQRQELMNNIRERKAHLEKLESDRQSRQKELQLLQTTIAEASTAINESESGSIVHKSVMKESKSGKIKGIHGRLGDLGVIGSKYDVAIATACSFLDHIVVDNTDVGQECIEFLRKNNLGRANFIVLDKMKPAIQRPPTDIPSGAQRLFDLVNLKDKSYSNAMYFALNDTLVATNLEQAQSWAYGFKRWRVVTLDGKLFELSGTISGGGQVRRGGMKANFKSDITEEQVRQLQEKLRNVQTNLREIQSNLKSEMETINDSEEKALRTEAEIQLTEKYLKDVPVEMEMIKSALEDAKKSLSTSLTKKDQSEINKLTKLSKELQAKISGIKALMKPIEDELTDIQQQILDAGGIKFKVQKSRVDLLQEQIGNSEKRIQQLEKERISLQTRLDNLVSGNGNEETIAKIEKDISGLDEQLHQITASAVAISQEIGQAQSNLDEKSDIADKLKDRLDEILKDVSKFRKLEYELRCAIEADEQKIQAANDSISSCSTELGNIRLHHIDRNGPQPVLAVYEDEDLMELSKNLPNIKAKISSLKVTLEQSQPNLKVLDEFRIKEASLKEQLEELDLIESKRTSIRTNYEDLRRKRLDEFMSGFRTISAHLKEMYQLITLGGNAELELVDSLDPFSEGVLFSVMPPNKSWKNISNLSGGEKTLSSLALVFALHRYKPTPIYVMDEIDAALDFRNVSIIANYIKERTKDAQFIVISLRNNMFELADRLVGIYKIQQRTRSVTIDPQRFASLVPGAS